MERSDIGIVIPAFNEFKVISSVIDKVISYGVVIVVDDASSDKTGEIAKAHGAIVVKHATNMGYDQALSSGFMKAKELKCRYVITIDADGQHDASMIPRYVKCLSDSNDLVIGIRDRRQRFAEHVFCFVISVLYGIKDPLCGMKGYSIDLYNQLGHFDSYGSIGTELTLFGVKNHHKFVQMEVLTTPRQDAPHFGRCISANYKLLRALFLSFIKI